MNQDEVIEFKFPTVRSKLQNLFPFDPKSDVEIIFKNNKYELQTAYLRLESGFFKNYTSNVSKLIRIQEEFNEVYFEEVMKCFYGGAFKCPRSAIFEVWKIFQYLKIESFKKQSIKDMKQNFDKYSLFEIMTFSFVNDVEQIFSNCLSILDNNNFIQLKKSKEQFLQCPLELFRFLINNHNRRAKNKRALNFIEINSLLIEYSEKNEYSEEFAKDLKFQLIEKTELTAEEYRLIFIQGARTQSVREIPEINFSKKGLKVSNEPFLAQSAQIVTNKVVSAQQKQHWHQKLKSIKDSFQKTKSDSQLLQSSVKDLEKFVKKKNQESKTKQKALSKMQTTVREIEKEINEKKQSLKKITERIQKLESGSVKSMGKAGKEAPVEEEEKDQFVESHIIPGNFLGDIINEAQNNKKDTNALKPIPEKTEPTASTANFSKKKKTFYQSMQKEKQKQKQKEPSQPSQPSQEYIYKNFLIFDKEPISVPKRYLDSLTKLMDTDMFVKKRLNLLFRRSRTQKSNIGDPMVIRNRPALLILFETSQKKYAGGYISVQLPSYTKTQTFCDYQAFLFSLTHNVKMPIMKGYQKSAISLNKHYLLSFANDLMISNDCINEVSYCEWPTVYEVPKNSKCTSAKDLIGVSGEFRIDQIDVYEVKNEEIQMML